VQIVLATHRPSCLAGGLNSRQQQTNHHTNDRDHNQKLYERKGNATTHHSIS
jgi:hypothetical protein